MKAQARRLATAFTARMYKVWIYMKASPDHNLDL